VQAESGCRRADLAARWCSWRALRRLTDHDLEETASTRLLVMAARLVALGLPLASACRAAIVDALTDDADTAAALAEVVRCSVPCSATDPHGRPPCRPHRAAAASAPASRHADGLLRPVPGSRPRWTCCAST
jgi:hypothetical protein